MKVLPKILLADNISLEFAKSLETIETLAHPENISVMVYYDAPAGNFISAQIQKCLIDFARRFQLSFLQGHGIGYYQLDEKENEYYVSCGYQNSIVGANGALGFHVNEEELLHVLETGEFECSDYVVKHVKVMPGDNAKNACLEFIKENQAFLKNTILELSGELPLQTHRDICQILSQVCVSVRFKDNLQDFDYYLDLSKPTEKIILPHAYLNIEDLETSLDQKLDACFIGGCTGGSIEDLRLTASIWKDQQLPLDLRVCVAPSTNEVFLQAIEEGLIQQFIDCGAQILNAGCASCRTTSKGVLGSKEVMLATSMYNTEGCNGMKDSSVYLADTKTVAKSALVGKIVRG